MEGFLALIKEQREENDKLQSQLQEKEKIIEDAIKYVNKNKRVSSSHFNGKEYTYINYYLECEPDELLSILERK